MLQVICLARIAEGQDSDGQKNAILDKPPLDIRDILARDVMRMISSSVSCLLEMPASTEAEMLIQFGDTYC